MASRREDLGSWLEGTPGRGGPGSGSGTPPSAPPVPPGLRGGTGRRVLGVAVDWALALAVSALLVPTDAEAISPLLAGDPWATLGIFALSTTVLVGLLGHTIGHRVAGLRVVRLVDVVPPAPTRRGGGAVTADVDPAAVAPPGLVPALARTVLLCLVLPAVVWDGSGRGLHDVAAGTVVVRRRPARPGQPA